ncbi:uncharacterized protein A1O9_07533 [Exophiala aquamarina CBS 119918]|uniref:Uncharacterized protein n=1 Tax=Exophiala aquamarina CBS 119918 TaxID=1182545 RepID=A0A072P9J8_9EURO|nr:uncharacterized protein A1O9_07533 [Exophiala aquamarina CBS 119918]KEF55953.1 hypothetical protein A1O9_07533 [Exophiala aquamarina CBS 119918]
MSNSIPSLILYGPTGDGSLYTVDQANNRCVLFSSKVNESKPQLQMYRIVQGGLLQPLGTAAISSLSGSTVISIHGQEIKMKIKYESLTPTKSFTCPAGVMTWRSTSWGNGMELWDQAGVKLARYVYLKLSGDPKLEIFVPLNDMLLDLVVTAAVSLLVDDKKSLNIVAEVLGAA